MEIKGKIRQLYTWSIPRFARLLWYAFKRKKMFFFFFVSNRIFGVVFNVFQFQIEIFTLLYRYHRKRRTFQQKIPPHRVPIFRIHKRLFFFNLLANWYKYINEMRIHRLKNLIYKWKLFVTEEKFILKKQLVEWNHKETWQPS